MEAISHYLKLYYKLTCFPVLCKSWLTHQAETLNNITHRSLVNQVSKDTNLSRLQPVPCHYNGFWGIPHLQVNSCMPVSWLIRELILDYFCLRLKQILIKNTKFSHTTAMWWKIHWQRNNFPSPSFHTRVYKKERGLTSLMSIVVAQASKEFSISSFTTLTTDVITWELESRRTVSADSCFIVELEKLHRKIQEMEWKRHITNIHF